jgi:hypothetical protein
LSPGLLDEKVGHAIERIELQIEVADMIRGKRARQNRREVPRKPFRIDLGDASR